MDARAGFGWKQCGCARVTQAKASLRPDNRISHWRTEVRANSPNNRPVHAGGDAVVQECVAGFPPQTPIPMPEGDGDRNANPLYAFSDMDVRYHFVREMPLRVSALRSLGAHLNVFTIESMFESSRTACCRTRRPSPPTASG